MLDDKVLATLEEILGKTRSARDRLVAKIREAELAVEAFRHELAELENSATQTAIDSLRLNMHSGSKFESRSSVARIEDDGELRIERSEPRSSIQDLPQRDFRRESSVAYFNPNRGATSRHTDSEPIGNRFSDRTITQSCTLLLREAGRPLHVNELYKMLIAGGMKFKGNNPTISVAVSLSRNTRFCKVEPGTFDLMIREARQAAS